MVPIGKITFFYLEYLVCMMKMKYRLLIQRTINDNALDYVVISECKNYKSLTDSRRKLNNSANLPIH